MDELAEKIGMDPVELRLKNISTVSQATPNNPPYTTTGLKDCLEEGAKRFGWAEARKRAQGDGADPPRRRRGGRDVAGRQRRAAGHGHREAVRRRQRQPEHGRERHRHRHEDGDGDGRRPRNSACRSTRSRSSRPTRARRSTRPPSGGSKTVPTEAPADAAGRARREAAAARDGGGAAEGARRGTRAARTARSSRRPTRRRRSRSPRVTALRGRGLIVGVGYRGPEPRGQGDQPVRGALRRGRGEHADRRGEGAPLPRGAGQRPRDERAAPSRTRCRAASRWGIGLALTERRVLDRNQTGQDGQPQLARLQDPDGDGRAGRADGACPSTCTTTRRTTPAPRGSASRPPFPRRRPSPTPSTTRAACGLPTRPSTRCGSSSCWPHRRRGDEPCCRDSPTFAPSPWPTACASSTAPGTRLHAGGTDLLGCLRDGVFTAEKLVSLSGLAELRGHRAGAGRRPPHRRADDARADRRGQDDQRALPRARAGLGRRRQPAAAQPGHARRQPVPAAALLVLPRRLPLPAQGRRELLRRGRREPVPRDLRRRALLHRPPVGHGARAHRARRPGADRGAGRLARRAARRRSSSDRRPA